MTHIKYKHCKKTKNRQGNNKKNEIKYILNTAEKAVKQKHL